MTMFLLFFDGVGIAPPDEKANPITHFVNSPFPVEGSDYDFYNGILVPTDATLGVDGLPQSATGQTTILTGVNASEVEGRHVNAWPTTKLRELITKESLLKKIREAGYHPAFANAYHPDYFLRRHTRFSASTWSWLAAGIDYHNIEDLRVGNAVSHDLTNKFMNGLGFKVPVRKPAETGNILAGMEERYDFVLFEYILTDRCGHGQDMEQAKFRLGQISEFVTRFLSEINLDKATVILTSDHGNVEDLSTNTHNRNHVPTILWGKHAKTLSNQIQSIEDITPAILSQFRES